MHITTRPSPTFESIDIAVLLSVQGGCGKKQKQCCCPPVIAAPTPAPAPAPAPLAPPRAPAPSIETNVSISYQ